MMMVSTKGRYALRVMVDLAETGGDGTYVPLSDISKRQEISEKYLETIVSLLSRSALVESQRGKSGGYRLSRRPEEYTVGEILKATEGSFAPVACLDSEKRPCEKHEKCRTLAMWAGLYDTVDKYLESVSLADII